MHPHTTLGTVDPEHSARCQTLLFGAVANLTENSIVLNVFSESSWELEIALGTALGIMAIGPGCSAVGSNVS